MRVAKKFVFSLQSSLFGHQHAWNGHGNFKCALKLCIEWAQNEEHSECSQIQNKFGGVLSMSSNRFTCPCLPASDVNNSQFDTSHARLLMWKSLVASRDLWQKCKWTLWSKTRWAKYTQKVQRCGEAMKVFWSILSDNIYVNVDSGKLGDE